MKEQMANAVNSLVELMNDTMKDGYTFEDCWPATAYCRVEYNGKTYVMAIEARIVRQES